MSIPKEIIDLQTEFHNLPDDDYCQETPKYKALIKKYDSLNKRLEKKGLSIEEIYEMYIEVERELEDNDSGTEIAFIVDKDTSKEILEIL